MSQTSFKDHMGRQVSISFPPQRIISLCPSITETLFALGLEKQVIGRTRYCIHPERLVTGASDIGGTKQINRELIDQLQPDLIIAEKEENPKQMVEELAQDYPVFVVNVETFSEALQMIEDLGSLTGRTDQGIEIRRQIQEEFAKLQPLSACRAAYFIWRKPYMVAGNHTYIHSMLEMCGFQNVFKDYPGRYPAIEAEDLGQAGPDVLLLSSEPFPFSGKHLQEMSGLYPDALPLLVNGEMFSWYGVRMLQSVRYFNQLIDTIKNKVKGD